MTAYYNEFDPFAAQWLRNLIAAGHIAPGDVDDRDIKDVSPDDVAGYAQVHLFAGIGTWSYALRAAGWNDDREVWTGSCPCQPFSKIGKQKGIADVRNLWSEFHRLIAVRLPSEIFGEQVAGRAGFEWFARIRIDLERCGYAVGGADLCAAGVGSPQIRQRLYWLADSDRARLEGFAGHGVVSGATDGPGAIGGRSDEGTSGVFPGSAASNDADALALGSATATGPVSPAAAGVDALPVLRRLDMHDPRNARSGMRLSGARRMDSGRPVFERFQSIACADGWRRVEPGAFPLAYGTSDRVGRLRGYGNAIVAPLAAAFIKCFMECRP